MGILTPLNLAKIQSQVGRELPFISYTDVCATVKVMVLRQFSSGLGYRNQTVSV